jgi:hypothetical protein
MLSLFIISIIVSTLTVLKGMQMFKQVRDCDLGYEEIIAAAIVLGASINIVIDVMNIIAHPAATMNVVIKHMAVMSRLTSCLISYTIIQYVLQVKHLRLVSKEK